MSVLNAALMCLALNAYYEARGEPFDGQVAVGQVALRRAKHDIRGVCREIYRPHQFSWTRDRPRGGVLPRKNDPAWVRALQAARVALLWNMGAPIPDYSGGATHYHAAHVKPRWTRSMAHVASVGDHLFWRH